MVCHDVVSLVIYYFLGREVGLPIGGMPRCREFGYILFPRSWGRVYRRMVCHDVVRWGVPRIMMGVWYGILLVFFFEKGITFAIFMVIVFS